LSLMERFGDLRIYCFEPVPGTLACLERNLAESQRRGANQVTVVEAALGAADAETTIEFFPAAPGNSTLHSKEKHREFGDMMDVPFSALWKANKWMALFFLPVFPFRKRLYGPSFERLLADPVSIPCQVRTVSGMIRQHGVNRIDLLKIDVEGAELDVLAGIEECHWPLIRQISMEVAPANKKGVAALRDRLRAHGFAQVAADGMFGGESNLDDPLPAALYAVR